MTSITDINELNKIMRSYVMQQAELDGEFVRNSLSTYGETLDKLLFKQSHGSICSCDVLILFELINRDSSSNKSMTEIDDTVTMYMSYTFKLIIYGSMTETIANKLVARMRTASVRERLDADGVYLENIATAKSVNEFKNGIMLCRQDIDIDISCMMSVKQVSDADSFASIEQPEIIIEGDKLYE